MNLIDNVEELSKLFNSVEDNGDVYFVPSFSGLFSPHWDDTARGNFLINPRTYNWINQLYKKRTYSKGFI
jgi:glycerol kinase